MRFWFGLKVGLVFRWVVVEILVPVENRVRIEYDVGVGLEVWDCVKARVGVGIEARVGLLSQSRGGADLVHARTNLGEDALEEGPLGAHRIPHRIRGPPGWGGLGGVLVRGEEGEEGAHHT